MENTENKPFLGKFLRGFFELLFLLLIILAFFWVGGGKIIEDRLQEYLGNSKDQTEEKKLPDPVNPKIITYEWEYAGKKYSIEETLFGSYFNFYTMLPKTYSYYEGEMPQNWEEEYFSMFLSYPTEDRTIPELAAKIKELGTKNNLSGDSIVELALSFVQNIPYDEARAKRILSENQFNQSENKKDAPNYPYEVLYEKTGICSDKSFLAYSLIKELGYGVAVFVYEAENHMAIGIKCPKEYSTYNSGYCYAETTNPGNKIGLIPEIDTTNNQAYSVKEIELFGNKENSIPNSKTVGEAKIINTSEGNVYGGIIKTIATQQKIAELKTFLNKEKIALNSMQDVLSQDQKWIKDQKEKMNKLLDKNSLEKYNDLVPEYNEHILEYQKDLKNYNNHVKTYNQKVNEYNSLIKNFH